MDTCFSKQNKHLERKEREMETTVLLPSRFPGSSECGCSKLLEEIGFNPSSESQMYLF